MDTLDSINHQNFPLSTDVIKKVNRRAIDWEKVFATYIPDRTLVSRMFREALHVSVKKTNLI